MEEPLRPGMGPCPNKQAQVTEMPEIGGAGQRQLVSWKCGRPRSRDEKACLPRRQPSSGNAGARQRGEARPALGTCWALDAKVKPKAGRCPTGPPEPAGAAPGGCPGAPPAKEAIAL